MLPSAREIVFHAPISRLSLANENTLHVIDTNCALHKIDLTRLEITKSTTLNTAYTPNLFDYYYRPFALGSQKAYVSFSAQGLEYILDIRGKLTQLCSFEYNTDTNVTKACFSHTERLLLTGNEKGRCFIIQTDDGHLIAELPRASDTISAVGINEDCKLVARASFSKSLLIYRYTTQYVVLEMHLEAVIEMLTLVDEHTVLAITRNGKILKINIDKGTIIQETLLDENLWPSFMCLSHSQKFVYVGTRESVLFALHVKSLEVLFHIKLPYLGITDFVRTSRYFIFGFKSGELLFLNHREFEEQFILSIKLKKIKEASRLFQKNIFLMSHRDTRLIYDEWLAQKETIVNLLSLGHFDEARALSEPFLFHPKCKLEFSQIEELQPELMALHRYFRSSSLEAAYALCQAQPLLKKSSLYAQMEAQWNKSLQKAQILLSREPVLNKEAAKESLRAFLDVHEKKALIEQMLHNSHVFMLSESAIRDKNFSLYFKMVAQNPFLEFTPLYKKVLLLGEKLQMQITTFLEEKNYAQALHFSSLLSHFAPYKNQAVRLKEVCNALSILEYHIEHNHLLEAIKVQEQFKLGLNYEPIKALEAMKLAFQAEQLAHIERKDYTKVYAALVPYMSISICKHNVSFVIRRLYIAQFNNAFQTCALAIDWGKSLQAYVQLFGTDALLNAFIKEHHLSPAIVSNSDTVSATYPKDLLVLKN